MRDEQGFRCLSLSIVCSLDSGNGGGSWHDAGSVQGAAGARKEDVSQAEVGGKGTTRAGRLDLRAATPAVRS